MWCNRLEVMLLVGKWCGPLVGTSVGFLYCDMESINGETYWVDVVGSAVSYNAAW